MKHKSTLILLALVVVGSVVAYSLSRRPTSEELAKQRKRLLPGLAASEVSRLVIEGEGARIVCERSNEEWRISAPIQARADRWSVEDILDKLELAERVSYVHPEPGRTLKPQSYGLHEPRRKVTIRTEQPAQKTWTIEVGDTAGVADAYYVRVRGREGVAAVPKDVIEKTNATVAELRSKKLAPRISGISLEGLTISAPAEGEQKGFEVECARADGTWELKRPFHDLADEGAVEEVADAIYDHRIEPDQFVADDAAKAAEYGLDSPNLTIDLEGEEESQRLLFAERETDGETTHYAVLHGEEQMVQVPGSLLEKIRKQPADLRQKDLLAFNTEDVATVKIANGGEELALQRQNGGWRIAGDRPADADQDVVETFTRKLGEATVQRFVANQPESLAPYGLTEEERTALTLQDENGEPLGRLFFGRQTGDEKEQVYAMRPPYPPVLAVERADYVRKLQRGRLAFLNREILDVPPGQARDLVVKRPEVELHAVWGEEEARWSLRQPIEGPASQAAVRRIVGDFAPLRAAAFAAEKAADLSRYGLEEPHFTVKLTHKQRGEEAARVTRELRVGAAAEAPAEGRYAALAGADRVFVIPPRMVEHLTAGLASREICSAEDLVGLVFRRSEETAEYRYDDEQETWTDAEGGALPEPKQQALREAARLLRRFRAREVAAYSVRAPGLYGFDEPHLQIELREEKRSGKRVLIGKRTEDGGRYVDGPANDYVLVASREDVETLAAVFDSPGTETEESAAQ